MGYEESLMFRERLICPLDVRVPSRIPRDDHVSIRAMNMEMQSNSRVLAEYVVACGESGQSHIFGQIRRSGMVTQFNYSPNVCRRPP